MPSSPFGPLSNLKATERHKPPPPPVIPLLADGTPRPSPFALRARRTRHIENWLARHKHRQATTNDN